tara:strand:- start:686 stop:1738 length:1053 start_codon:yes stop_codon:yes gene_type:complete
MKTQKFSNLPLDEFIDFCLYNKNFGYYMKRNPFGKKGDFITAPNISRLFSEMIAIWILSFWKSLGSPKKVNIVELGAGNGMMMKVLIESFQNFPDFFKSCNFLIHEKSPSLIKIQKKNLNERKITWISKMDKIKNEPSIFIANEFFDSLAIKQFRKKKNQWFEKFVNFENPKKAFFFEKKINIGKIEQKINFKISQNQNFIEYSNLGFKYLRSISKIIKKNTGGLLLIDYGYNGKKMRDTLQAVSNHKFANILSNIGKADITHNISFSILKSFLNKIGGLNINLSTQKDFLINMGIKKRAEIISQKESFLKKADIYYRLKRLIGDNEMGNLFKVMLIRNKKNKFKVGFKN